MKHLLLLFLFVPIFLFSQTEPFSLNIDGKSHTTFYFKDNTLSVVANEGVTTISPRGKRGEITTYNLEDGSIINQYKAETGINLYDYTTEGYYLTGERGGAIFNPFNSNTFDVISNEEKNLGEVKLDIKDIYNLGTKPYITKDYFYLIAPEDKNYNFNKKLDNPVNWIIHKMNLKTLKQERVVFTPKPNQGHEHINGYSLIDVIDDKFYMVSKKLGPENNLKNGDNQEIILSSFDFKGNLVDEKSFFISIDNSKYSFNWAQFPNSYFFLPSAPNIPSRRGYKSSAIGTVIIDYKTDSYFIISELENKSKSKENQIAMYIAKYNKDLEKMEEIVVNNLRIYNDKFQAFDGKLLLSGPVLGKKESRFFALKFSEDSKLGDVRYFSDYKVYSKMAPNGHQTLRGFTFNPELNKRIILDKISTITYHFSNGFNSYLKGLSPKSDTFYYSHIMNDGSVYVVEADYRNRKFKLLKF